MISGTQITPLQRADIPELSQFLVGSLGLAETSPIFSPEVLAWKYFDGPSGPSGDSSRSLIARAAGRIVGHIGMCPRQLIVPGHGETPVSTMHAIDWHCSAAHPGSGALLMLRAFATSKTQFAVGSTLQAQAVLPRLGFEQKSNLATLRKVLKPSHRLWATDEGLFRKWAGTAKNIASDWISPKPPMLQAVALRSVPTFSEEIDCLQRRSALRIVMCQLDHVRLNYLLRCPLSGFSGWTIHTSQRLIGFAVLKITPHGRIQIGIIVDCWLDTEDPSYWQAAVAAINDRLRAHSVYFVTADATNPFLHAGLLLNGFAQWAESSVYVRDRQQLLPRGLLCGLSRNDADGAIL